MAGTKIGGMRAAQTNLKKYGKDFYKNIGSIGGSKKDTLPKGFAYSQANGFKWHIEAGAKGGKISKRKPSWTKNPDFVEENNNADN